VNYTEFEGADDYLYCTFSGSVEDVWLQTLSNCGTLNTLRDNVLEYLFRYLFKDYMVLSNKLLIFSNYAAKYQQSAEYMQQRHSVWKHTAPKCTCATYEDLEELLNDIQDEALAQGKILK